MKSSKSSQRISDSFVFLLFPFSGARCISAGPFLFFAPVCLPHNTDLVQFIFQKRRSCDFQLFIYMMILPVFVQDWSVYVYSYVLLFKYTIFRNHFLIQIRCAALAIIIDLNSSYIGILIRTGLLINIFTHKVPKSKFTT